MTSAAARAIDELDATDVQICVAERADALVLMAILTPYRSFLVQLHRDRWVVHARVPGRRGERLQDLLATIETLASRRGLSKLACTIGGQAVEVSTTAGNWS